MSGCCEARLEEFLLLLLVHNFHGETKDRLIESFEGRRDWAPAERGTMLKITKIDTETDQRLILEGRLANPWIAGLGSHWKETRHAHPEREFVVDLKGVVRIDNAGECAVALMKAEGARFLAGGIRMKHLIRNLEIKAQGYGCNR